MVNEYTTAAYVQAELRTTTSFSSSTYPSLATLSNWIEEISAYIDQVGERVYGVNSYTETLDHNGEELLLLENAPVLSVTNVLYSSSELGSDTYGLTDTKTEGTDYSLYDNSGEIVILSNWSPMTGRKRIQVTYTAGYNIVPLTIQMLATKIATKRTIDSLLSKDINEKQSGKSVSVGSISIVKPANFGVQQYEKLKIDIDELEQKIMNGSSAYRIGVHRY